MAMQLLAGSVRNGSTFLYRVWLDTARTVPDPADPARTVPDPLWVIERSFGAPPRGVNEAGPAYSARLTAFEASARAEMRLLATDALAARTAAPVDLAGVGAPL